MHKIQVQYRSNAEGVSWESVQKLIIEVGWPERPIKDIVSSFGKSSFIRFAYLGDDLVGFGRTIDDGQYYGMVVDLIVSPKHQRKGIGSTILRQLSEEMKHFYTVSLIAAPGKNEFYERAGWEQMRLGYHLPRRVRMSVE